MAQNIQPNGHDEIVGLIHSLNVGPGQSLRQVMVPEVAYTIAKNFLKWAPNIIFSPDNTPQAYRFKVLQYLPQSGESIYTLLVIDAGNTTLADASQKIEDWKEATKSLLRYALNLKLAPKRPEFQRMKLSSSYYVYQVAKKLQGAEKILLCMGYEPVSGSANEIQELKYGGEVNTLKVIHTAADLVILHSELDRIRDLVIGAIQSNYINVTLRDILEARGNPNDTLASTLQRSLTCSLVRLRKSRQAQVVQQSQQAPALPPRGQAPQRQPFAQLKPPAMEGQHLSFEYQQGNQNILPSGRRSSAPDVQADQLDRRHQPPPSPLLQQSGPPVQPSNVPVVPLNSKEKYNLDKTIDKSQGKGIDSVKCGVVPDASSPVAKGASIPFDPMNLPEPAFDTHDLEMFHQEAYHMEDHYVSGNMSLLINPRSDDFGDFSGPNLDDHLAYRSHNSGHMGLSESPASSAFGKTAEENIESKRQQLEVESEQEDTCISGKDLVCIPNIQQAEEAHDDDVSLKKDDGSSSSRAGALFQIGEDTSIDSQVPSVYSQAIRPVVPPRSFSGREENKMSRRPSESSLPTVTSSGMEHLRPRMPRPMSDNNLRSKGTPPNSPSRSTYKPTIAPRRNSPHSNRSDQPSTALSDKQSTNTDVSAEDVNATTAICTSSPLTEFPTIADEMTSGIESGNLLSGHEAHTSLESSSPRQSLESNPSMSNKSDPCSSTPSDEAPSACQSGEKLVFQERNTEGYVEITLGGKESSNVPTTLDSQPRHRDRSAAFSTKSDKTVPVSDKVQKPKTSKGTPREETYTDLRNATPCWYCTNLTALRICDVCGNEKKRETTV